MRRFRFFLCSSTVTAAVLACGSSAWAQASQPPSPAATNPARPPAGATTATGTSGQGKPPAGGTTTGTSGQSKPSAGATGAGTTGTAAPASNSPTSPTSTSPSGTGSAQGTQPSGTAGASGSAGASASVSADMQPADNAETLFRRGNELAKKVGWAEAEPFYRAAWKLKESYDIAANLGLACYQQKKWSEAARFLAFALRSFPASGKPENRALLESSFATVKAEVGELSIKVSESSARVAVDGKEATTSLTKETVFVDPGKRTIEATLEGFEPARKTIDVVKGTSQEVSLSLTPKKKPPPPDTGWKPTPVYFIAGGAAAAVGLGAGVAFTIVANGKSSDADALRASVGSSSACYRPTAALAAMCDELSSKRSSQWTFSNLAVGSFIAGGVFALGTAGLAGYTLMRPASSQEGDAAATIQLSPVIGAEHRGVVLSGAW